MFYFITHAGKQKVAGLNFCSLVSISKLYPYLQNCGAAALAVQSAPHFPLAT